ncbi:MAG: hypothetical protein CM1200mP2_27530 [Planctomycetaceae bacterium]|nr:MAG: hypothetical protein CM1200mP2_27530 [Planctomycetaceae bacterium]
MHGKKPRGGDPVWSSGFLPSVFQATALDPRQAKPINNLQRSGELTDPQQRTLLDALRAANDRHAKTRPFDRDLSARLESFELAYRMQVAAPEAFDIGLETKQTQEAYGLNRQESKDYGRQCLIARRLIERGVRFSCRSSPTWPRHLAAASTTSPGTRTATSASTTACGARSVDQPTGALLDDLKQRGLLDDTLVIYGGEFGRTSDSQGAKGRDHNPNAFTTWMAGGGVKGGDAVRGDRHLRLQVRRQTGQCPRPARDDPEADGL